MGANEMAKTEGVYVEPKRLSLDKQNRQPEGDIHRQIEQVFGVDSEPVSHRAILGDSIHGNLNMGNKQFKDKKYEERISHLESEIVYLRSLIHESDYHSRKGSPVRSQLDNVQSGEIQESRSRMSLTYFRSHDNSFSNG